MGTVFNATKRGGKRGTDFTAALLFNWIEGERHTRVQRSPRRAQLNRACLSRNVKLNFISRTELFRVYFSFLSKEKKKKKKKGKKKKSDFLAIS